jgi:hypothetical protein
VPCKRPVALFPSEPGPPLKGPRFRSRSANAPNNIGHFTHALVGQVTAVLLEVGGRPEQEQPDSPLVEAGGVAAQEARVVFCWRDQMSFLVNGPGVRMPIEDSGVVMPACSMAKHDALRREQGEFNVGSTLARKLAQSARCTLPRSQSTSCNCACLAFLYHDQNPRVATGGADRRHSLVQTAFTVLIEHGQAGVEPLSVARRGCGGACPWPVLPLPADNPSPLSTFEYGMFAIWYQP